MPPVSTSILLNQFGNHFNFYAGAQRNLRHAEGRARMLAGVAEYFADQFRSAIGDQVLLGEFAEEGVLAGQRAIPAALERDGFHFHHNTIGEALAYATMPRDVH